MSQSRSEVNVVFMLKIFVLGQCHGLSFFELKEQCIDLTSFKKCIGFLELY